MILVFWLNEPQIEQLQLHMYKLHQKLDKSEQSQAVAKNACLAFKQIPIAKDATYAQYYIQLKLVNLNLILSITKCYTDTFVINGNKPQMDQHISMFSFCTSP
jgi:hypothetical protein